MDVMQEGAGKRKSRMVRKLEEEFKGRRAFTGWCCHMGRRMEAREAFLTILCLKPICLFIFIYI